MTKKKSSEKKKVSRKSKNIWKISFFASVVVIIILLGIIFTGFGINSGITSDSASQAALSLINGGMVPPGTQVSIDSVTDVGKIYKLNISLTYNGQNQEIVSYMSKDGKYFFPQGMDINEVLSQIQNQKQQTPQTPESSAPKSDTPKAEAFVMSHCPYGLQFMKAFVPVMDLLKDKADLQIGFVDYIMHGVDEFNDNNRIYCIQKETPSKLTEYLRCYVENKGYETCLQEAGIEKTTIDTCIQNIDEEYNLTNIFKSSTSQFPKYPLETELNDKYGVKGSPTFVINGKSVSVSRSAEAIKEAICSAFNNPPAECDTQLSTSAESAGFGPIGEGSGSNSGGGCGS